MHNKFESSAQNCYSGLCCSSVDVFYYPHMRDVLVKNELCPPLCSDRATLLVELVVVEHIDLFHPQWVPLIRPRKVHKYNYFIST